MIRLFALAAAGLMFHLSTPAQAAGIDARAFFKGHAGLYTIKLHNGVKPDGNSPGRVEDQGEEGFMEMPFCVHGGGACDVGYIDFPYSSTQVEETELAPNHHLFRISSTADGVTNDFEWESEGPAVRFRRLNYKFPSGSVATLEFILDAPNDAPNETTEIVVDTAQFFKTRLGSYKIDLNNGEKPHANSIATVEDLGSDGEALITMGYCDDKLGFCDIGYRDCPYKSTVITDTTLTASRHVFKITATNDDASTRVYEWEEDGDHVWFRSLNYPLPNGTVLPSLEHVLTKLP
ncbi:MAG: hypothetical protein HYR96_01925 [Deltaproteobacteria bacterium]|nr:hypothetical protein [Deltaproteobacteria bacterium]MBI3293363.1 hypothetical protein [Deltaproteobacteria bacterium]